MATLTAPGVYVEEISSGVRPIAAAGTSTAAFFGEAERGPIGEVAKIFNFTEFQAHYGNYLDGGRYLAHSVYQFFNNGGSTCYIGRVAPGAATASVQVTDRGTTAENTLTFEAVSPGLWGNSISVFIDSSAATDTDNQFNLTVFEEVLGVSTEVEVFTDLSMNPNDPNYVAVVVNVSSNYVRVVNEGSANVINGFSESALIVVDGNDLLGAGQRELRININSDGFQTVDLTTDLAGADLTVAENIRAAIETVVQGLPRLRASTDAAAYSGATVAFNLDSGGPNGQFRITAGGAAGVDSRVEIGNAFDTTVNAAGALLLGPANGGTEVFGSSELRPQNNTAGDFYFLGDDTVDDNTVGPVSLVIPGSDGGVPQALDFINALNLLDTVRDVSLIAIPGIGITSVIDGAMNYCANIRPLSDCFFIGDMDVDDDTYTEAVAFQTALANPNSYGAVYFPWLYTLDPSGQSAEPIMVPPSGFIAGLYSRIDGRRGVWKAPAGTEAILSGVTGLVTHFTDVQQGDLNNAEKSIAVIRKFPSTGFVSWGARTVSNDAEFKYIPVRRTAIMLRVSIFNGIQYAVFEPNDEPLWSSLRLNIGTFMNTLFRRGAFQGATAAEAYFVKCDSETTTQADIDLGIVNVLVGFAPLKPAEFVVVKIQQIAGQTP